ncbi:MAG TPA: NAD-dependent epimerase/dehydratase family protein [Dehalococcoidia bacterium]|jgi:NADH dehydrogenase|nr:NAD-dependent epimerase/dehydratase family protein [Dehalococcoidia bacterium]
MANESSNKSELNVVTGAFGYTGKYIARRLLADGIRVKTLTGHPERPNPFGAQVVAAPFNFDDLPTLIDQLSGASTLYNTYWVRFSRGEVTFDRAVENTRTLIQAAKDAGVGRIVHVSITNPSLNSSLPYFRGKAQVEEAIIDSGISYAIIRPTVIFGIEDILINNIAWMLRRFPLFVVPGGGGYRFQPIFVEDLAGLAVDAGGQEDNLILDAAGPETYTFDEFVRLVGQTMGSRTKIVHLPSALALGISKIVGYFLGDVVLTRDEITGLMSDLLISDAPPAGNTSLKSWLTINVATLGGSYTSELDRHYRR